MGSALGSCSGGCGGSNKLGSSKLGGGNKMSKVKGKMAGKIGSMVAQMCSGGSGTMGGLSSMIGGLL